MRNRGTGYPERLVHMVERPPAEQVIAPTDCDILNYLSMRTIAEQWSCEYSWLLLSLVQR